MIPDHVKNLYSMEVKCSVENALLPGSGVINWSFKKAGRGSLKTTARGRRRCAFLLLLTQRKFSLRSVCNDRWFVALNMDSKYLCVPHFVRPNNTIVMPDTH